MLSGNGKNDMYVYIYVCIYLKKKYLAHIKQINETFLNFILLKLICLRSVLLPLQEDGELQAAVAQEPAPRRGAPSPQQPDRRGHCAQPVRRRHAPHCPGASGKLLRHGILNCQTVRLKQVHGKLAVIFDNTDGQTK